MVYDNQRVTKRPVAASRRRLLCDAGLDGFGLLLETWLFQKGEHVLLVRLDTRLVERIHTEGVGTYATSELEEIEQCTENLLIDPLNGNLQLRHTAVDVGELGTELRHCNAQRAGLQGS